jgi:hypothetical protein
VATSTTLVPSAAAEEYRAGQAALVSLIPALLREAWPLLDLHNLKGTLPAFFEAVKAIVARFGQASSAAALDFYRRERLTAGVPGSPLLRIAPTQADAVIEVAVRVAVTDLYGPAGPGWAASQERVLQAVSDKIAGLVLDQSRQTQIDAVLNDREAKGWVRVTRAGACSFCIMLALRGGTGLLYTSRESANFRAHMPQPDGSGGVCQCTPAPVFTKFEPSAHMREMQKLWESSTKGRSGNDARNAFRQAVEGRPVTGTTGAKKARNLLGDSNMDRPQAEFLLAQAQRMKDSPWRTKQIARLSKLLAGK